MTPEIPGYEVFERIGSGGMAEVFRGRHLRLDRDVALKVMLERYSEDSSFCDRFIREARIAANLSHPNIVQIYDVNRYKGSLFLAMEYVPGGDLTHRLSSHLSKTHIISIIRDLSLALDFAHQQGYVHRDIKPANILFRDNDKLALSDFGIARAIHSDTHMTQTGMVIGTPSYMSPEQAQGKAVSGASDRYSVAVIAYQLVTGQLPYQAESSISVAIKHINDPIPTLYPELAFLQDFFDQALAKQSEDRFESGEDMAEAFAALMHDNAGVSSYQEATTLFTQRDEQGGETHAGFASHTHADASINALETALLEGELQTPGFEKAPADEKEPAGEARPEIAPVVGREGSVSGQPFTSAAMMLMQINKIKVFIFQPEKRSRLFIGLMTLLLVMSGIHFVQNQQWWQPKDAPLSAAQQMRVAQLLNAAETDRIEARLVSPIGNNAYEKYLTVLAIDPGHTLAQKGREGLIENMRENIQMATEQGQFDRAMDLLDALVLVQAIDENDALYSVLAEKMLAHDQQVAEMLLQADAVIATDRDMAIRQFTAVLSLDSDNSKARNTLSKIANAELALAHQKLKNQAIEKATVHLERVEHIETLDLGTGLGEEIVQTQRRIHRAEESRQFSQTLNDYLNRAKKALSLGYITQPEKNNAHYYYVQALALSPNNTKVLAGLQSVYRALEAQATAALERGNTAEAEKHFLALQSLAPTDSAVPRLREGINDQKRADARKYAVVQKVNRLYERADIYLASNRAKSADKMYAQIHKLSPGHGGLKPLGGKIADAYVVLAQKEIDGRDWRDVSVWVQRGLRHVPNHQKLLDMQRYADQQLGLVQGN